MRFIFSALAAAALSLPAVLAAQSALPAGTASYTVHYQGKDAGSATYTIQPASAGGYSITAHGEIHAGNVTIAFSKTEALDPQLEIASEALDGKVNKSAVTFNVKPDGAKFTISISADGQLTPSTLDRHARTVFFTDFDPSALVILNAFYGKDPKAPIWVLIPKRTGLLFPVKVEEMPAAKGTLNSAAVAARHLYVTIAGGAMDVYFSSTGDLLQQEVPDQGFSMVRDGFKLSPPEPPAGVTERELTFPSPSASDPTKLDVPARLVLPANPAKPVPLVVLVAGSGSHDADETIGPNKPFRDLAWALAQQGIGSLRYDKRTRFAPETLREHTDLDHEVTIDAVAALAFASTVPGVNPARIFLAGHSLGAQMAPYIVQQRLEQKPASVRGMILLAGIATPIDAVVLRQIEFQERLAQRPQAQIDQDLAAFRAKFAHVNDPRTPPSENISILGGSIPVGYWRDWLARDPAPLLKTLALPTLVLRGEKDIQVSEQDFRLLAAAATAKGSEARQFPNLNHLFMPVTGESTGAEYSTPGHVAPEAISTIASWIAKLL